MTNRNELERLLAAATDGPWQLSPGNETEIQGVPKKQVARAHCGGMTGVRLVEAEANAALIVHLVNNAHHYLSLMDEVERLREALDEDVLEEAISDTLDLDWQPSWAAKEIRRRAGLGETHDN